MTTNERAARTLTAAVPDSATHVTLAQLCVGWQCSESSVRRLMRDGAIPFVHVGRLLRFPRDLLARGPTATAGRGGKCVEVRG